MLNRGLLTEEIFRKIKFDIASTAFQEGMRLNKFYDVELKIKPEYAHLDPNMELLQEAKAHAIKENIAQNNFELEEEEEDYEDVTE